MFGLGGEAIVKRARVLAAGHAGRLDLPTDASDAQLRAAAAATVDAVAADRRLRRPLRDPTVRSIVDSLVMWEVVVATVGTDAAEARWLALRGVEPTPGPPAELPAPMPVPVPAVRGRPARTVRRRPRRLPDVQADAGLAAAVHAEATGDDDPLHADGYEHHVWLDEWVELAVGSGTFDGLEAAVAAHPLVDVALHEDREALYVAAPTLHPEDVRAVVLELLADTYDPEWQRRL